MARLITTLLLALPACFMLIHQAPAGDISLSPTNLTFTRTNQSAWINRNTAKTSLAPENLLAQAEILIRSGQLKAALQLVKTALGLNDRDHHAWNTLGELHQRLGHSALAMKAFNKAHALDPELATTCEYG